MHFAPTYSFMRLNPPLGYMNLSNSWIYVILRMDVNFKIHWNDAIKDMLIYMEMNTVYHKQEFPNGIFGYFSSLKTSDNLGIA